MDFDRIDAAIRYLEEHQRRQPGLEEVAAHVGLSPFHFQRLFKRWAGVSPKRFLQFLTAEHAKTLLRDSATVLDAAYASGLSGPGRLHDLLVAVEAMTPGEIRQGGVGLDIRYGVHESPFGKCLIATTERGICFLGFDGDLSELEAEWPAANLLRDQRGTAPLVSSIFPWTKPVRLHIKGTNFQLKVWSALLSIPEGEVVSYSDVASAVGNPEASRAAASAIARNPVSFLIPCHRVLRTTGALGGYRWGPTRKRAILAWESARS